MLKISPVMFKHQLKIVGLNFKDVTWPVTFIQLIIHIVNVLNDLCARCATVLAFKELGTLIRSNT